MLRLSSTAVRVSALCLVLALGYGIATAQTKPDALKMYREGRFEEARTTCLSEIRVDPDNIESYVVLVWSLISLERYADAEIYAKKAYTTVRKDARIVESLGEAAYYQGKNEQALEYFMDYVNLLPDGSRLGQVYYLTGETYLRLVKLQHADIAIRTALQYEPKNARWWTRLGYVRERDSDWAYALEAYEAALLINPGLVDAVRGKERVLARVRR
ncbi:tetratricopeptide repeat protein [Spirochaetota bacterium]